MIGGARQGVLEFLTVCVNGGLHRTGKSTSFPETRGRVGLSGVRVGFTPTGPLAEGLTLPFSHLPRLARWDEGALHGGAEAARPDRPPPAFCGKGQGSRWFWKETVQAQVSLLCNPCQDF